MPWSYSRAISEILQTILHTWVRIISLTKTSMIFSPNNLVLWELDFANVHPLILLMNAPMRRPRLQLVFLLMGSNYYPSHKWMRLLRYKRWWNTCVWSMTQGSHPQDELEPFAHPHRGIPKPQLLNADANRLDTSYCPTPALANTTSGAAISATTNISTTTCNNTYHIPHDRYDATILRLPKACGITSRRNDLLPNIGARRTIAPSLYSTKSKTQSVNSMSGSLRVPLRQIDQCPYEIW